MLQLSFTPFPNLTTERLVLKQLTIEDEKEIFLLRSDESVNKYLDRPKASSLEDARNFINKINNSIANNESIYWAITLKNQSTLIGTILYWNISIEHSKAEIGYELLPGFEGKGIMQEAISKVIEFGFDNMKLTTIEAYTNPDNYKSSKLLEKNNFRKNMLAEREKDSKGEMISHIVYSLTKQTR